MSESGEFFQLLTHDNYEQRNGIQLQFFYTSPMLGVLQQTEGLSRHKLHQNPNFVFKFFFFKKLKIVRIWSLMNVEGSRGD